MSLPTPKAEAGVVKTKAAKSVFTEDEIVEIIGHSRFTMLEPDELIADVVLSIERLLESMVRFGINVAGASLSDFDMAVISGQMDTAVPFQVFPVGPEIVFRHKRSKETSIHVAFPAAGTHWATAVHLSRIHLKAVTGLDPNAPSE